MRADRRRLVAAGGALALAATGALLAAGRAAAPAAAPSPLDAVASLGPPPDAAGVRFSVDGPQRAPRAGTSGDARARTAVAARVARLAAAGVDPVAMQAAALLDLRWGDTTAGTRARAEALLVRATRLAPAPRAAAIHADLAAARLLRAARTGSGRALLEAIESAERALALDPTSVVGHHALVVALDRLGCTQQAALAARAALAVDGASVWASMARRVAAGPGRPAPDAAAARREGWDDALGRWGSALLAGDTTTAATSLARARALGDTLAARGGDRSLQDAVRAIDAAPDGAARARLADAHAAFAEGARGYDRGAYREAGRAYARAAAGAAGSPALRLWARAMAGAARVHDGDPAGGGAALTAVLAEVDVRRHPAVAGRAHATLGTSLFRRGLDTASAGQAAAAATAYAAAGERESLGSVQMLRASVLLSLGDDRGFDVAVQTLETLRAVPGSLWRHPMLAALADEALAAGLPRAAERLQDEDVDAGARSGRPSRHAEALLQRVVVETTTGRRRHVADDLRDARRLLAALPPGIERAWTEANVGFASALAERDVDPVGAARAAGTAVAFHGATPNLVRLLPALTARADAHVAAGRAADALRDLAAAAAIVGDRAARAGSAASRARLVTKARGVLARAVLLEATLGGPREALVALERTRALLTGGTARASTDPRRWLSAGEVGVSYVRVADTLLTWTVADGAVTFARRTLGAARLDTLLSRARTLAERRASEAAMRPVLAELHALLVQPIAAQLGAPGTTLVLAVDGGLATVPFAALFDAGRGAYLVERHALRFVTSLSEPVDGRRASRVAGPRADDVVLIGAPTLDAAAFGALAPLPGATAEVAALDALYPGARTLSGAAATPAAVLTAMRGARVLHFAGHAVFDDAYPERSYLALAGPAPDARLSAPRVAGEALAGLRLVVLSACETSGATPDAMSGTDGLPAALRGAGVAGVVASAWRVDDASTRPLMVEFHRAFRADGRGPEALRAAQRRMLASPPPLRSPSTWAAFRLVGR